MTKEEYIAQRTALLTAAREAESNADADAMTSYANQIEELDNAYREAAVKAANEKAIAGIPGAIDIKNVSQNITGGKVVETMENNNKIVYTAESKEYHDGFLKNLLGQKLEAVEAEAMQAVAVSAPGVIPTETVRKIYGKLKEAPLLSAINLMHIPSNLSIPVSNTVNDAEWVEMNTAATDSADAVVNVDLGAYKLIKTLDEPANLSRMAIPEFEEWLVNGLVKKIRSAADAAICAGNGTGKATGMLHSGSITNAKTFTAGGMTFTDLMAIIGALPSQYLPGASFVMPSALFWSDVMGMKDTADRPIVVSDPTAPAAYRVMGFPVIIDDNMTADNLVFGDLNEGYTFNFAADPAVARDESVGFRTGSACYRCMALADGKVVDKNALVKANRGV